MKFVSTRGGTKQATFEETLFSCYCQDGGLFVPEAVPEISKNTLRDWSKLSFVELAQRIARLYIDEDEIPTNEINGCIERAFMHFSHPGIAPVVKLRGGLNILELFHGRTLAFKDIALSFVGELLEYFLKRRRKRVIIVVVTSGDTGSAAIESVKGKEFIDIVVFLPHRGCSEIQVLQMVTVIEDNVHVFKVENLGEVDVAVNRLSRDQTFTKQNGFMSVNSTNWARIMMQIVHYFYGYLQVCPNADEEMEFVVPTGACGNIAAGIYAKQMGLPVKFVCAGNLNDIVARTISKGHYSVSPVMSTLAPAMDIQYPYNLERVMYVLSGADHVLIAAMYKEFELSDAISVPRTLVEKLKSVIGTHTADDDRIKVVMRQCWEEQAYLVCPHTAVGLSYYYQQIDRKDEKCEGQTTSRICIATASPEKFPEALTSAGLTPKKSPKLASLEKRPTKFEIVPANEDCEDFMRAVISRISQMRKK
ncbi:threonine synthase-like 2 [Liolophura sinensis]|uniref:threonine synthase-like 2 n=1 Tax=Liolophura sinensis TaxID=3198878 RepID=UPI0031592F96